MASRLCFVKYALGVSVRDPRSKLLYRELCFFMPVCGVFQRALA